MNTNEVGHGSSQQTSVDSRLLDELIFKQDLNEVHLLIDFISGRADRSLSTLSMPHPTTPDKTMTSGEIVEAISKMRYPPPEGTPVINAQNAAILLQAKDKLSALAAPAKGVTIAYTTMFIDAEAGGSIVSRAIERFFYLVLARIDPTKSLHQHQHIDLYAGRTMGWTTIPGST